MTASLGVVFVGAMLDARSLGQCVHVIDLWLLVANVTHVMFGTYGSKCDTCHVRYLWLQM